MEKLTGDFEEMDYLKNFNEELSNENARLKSDLEEQMRLNKEMRNAVRVPTVSPSAKFRQKEYQYKCQIQDLQSEVKELQDKIACQARQIAQMSATTQEEIAIFQSKIATYRELLEDAKAAKDEMECEMMALQTEVNKPDFNRQGNNMYCEVDDRRVLAEQVVLQYQQEYQHLRNANADLRIYLEKAFDVFSEIKEEELTLFKRDYIENEIRLTKQNETMATELRELDDFVTKELKTRGDGAMSDKMAQRSLQVQLNINRSKLTTAQRQSDIACDKAEKAKAAIFSSYQRHTGLLVEVNELRKTIEKHEARLSE